VNLVRYSAFEFMAKVPLFSPSEFIQEISGCEMYFGNKLICALVHKAIMEISYSWP
jgi:hypothetical protein